MMTDNPRYQTAQNAAGDAIEALLTVYWSDSFEVDLLQDRLAETIFFFTRNARNLNEPHPHPEILEDEAIASSVPLSPNLDGAANSGGGK